MKYNEYNTPCAGWRGYIRNESTGKIHGWIATDGEFVLDTSIA